MLFGVRSSLACVCVRFFRVRDCFAVTAGNGGAVGMIVVAF